LAGLLVGVCLAVLFRNVWALAFSVVAAVIAQTAASYWIHPIGRGLRLDWSRLRELTAFSKWIVAYNVLGFWEQYMDSIVVGRFLGTAMLGLYQVAGR